ncbi:pyridoxine/pyridoxamine 5'-phosphate oxidase [Microbacterium stercoris]|uniref:Pyridoxamine 5'-phosphate oxidase family protein n=1 Tax=Microbacterium stercoris TaxID=2820289 RepID=A0A939QPM7_9MICO|nr:pyridoxamine 5'-phosphate oxidase family protein [Microbacterium stercoris]MBO3662458.1 pyridoxamine 5'-phosphate oxidase family protein [Microbacterium stercoris]MBO3664450.1 pyridoxamine 5'-phosphate oxidase family protein [Microbacterium stercoris]
MTNETWLRSLPALAGTAPAREAAAADPVRMFDTWIRLASESVAEPHAMTLATVDAHGVPDARTLLLKDFGARGFAFAGPRRSRKGAQLAGRSAAALSFWWQPLMRAVRARGEVVEASSEESAADLAARSAAARDGIDPADWVRWWLVPQRIEFWQGSPDRRHTRIVYTHADGGWQQEEQG